MYEAFYNLRGRPFSLLPDGDTLFPSKRHKRAMAILDYGVASHAGFIVISGEIGAGKTTIARHFLKTAGSDLTVGIVTNPSVSAGRLFDWITFAFGIRVAGDRKDTALYGAIVDFLVEKYGQGKRVVLIVDEAQNLTPKMLEDLRMLSNVNNEQDLLLQIVLVGQPEMLETLRKPELRQLVQRIVVHCHLDSLTPSETAAYIRYRLSLVGGQEKLFGDEACAAIHYFTGGVPRLINLLCDQALVYGFSEDLSVIPLPIVADVAMDRNEFGLSSFRQVSKSFSSEDLTRDIQDALSDIRKNAA
ncbi:MAG: AAA family ATPase [Alphaproteobacteria bacterium]|nr:AAA family ATPase [Alphaproteobacteria bacterium]